MNGIENAAVAVARDLWGYVREEMPHVIDLVTRKVPANDLYKDNRIREVYETIVAANRIELDNLMARYREDG